jgi:O-antigen/teichoic acid export membrane protein
MEKLRTRLAAPAYASFVRLLANSWWNFLGQGTGLIVAICAIPVLLKQLGTESFGLFTVFLAIIGYSGMLDLGIGRAVTAAVANHATREDHEAITSCMTTALALLTSIGILLAVLLIVFAVPIADLLVGSAERLNSDGSKALQVLALTVPIVLLSGGMRGALEGLLEFKVISKIMMPTSALMFAVPALLSFTTDEVTHMVASLLAVRLLSLLLLYAACSSRVRSLRWRWPSWPEARALLGAGGWMTVSNVASPIMTNLDRLFISAQISPAATALHVTPYELATKTLLPAGSIANATFPEFAAQQTINANPHDRRRYFWRAMLLTTSAAVLPALLLCIFAREILAIWISVEFANGVSTDILRILAIGIAVNGAAYIPFAFVQGIGRADVAAKFHLLELVVFVPALLYALQTFGLIGAAVVWVGRVIVDAILLFAYTMSRL